MIILIFIFWFLGIMFAVLAFIPTHEEIAIAKRLERLKIKRERIISLPRISKIFLPFAEIIANFLLKYFPKEYIENLNKKIEMAGEKGKTVKDVFVEKLITAIVFSLLSLLLLLSIFSASLSFSLFLSFLFFLVGFFTKDFGLASQIKKRHYLIERDLGDFLDQLNTCVQAGLGFNAALQYVIEQSPPSPIREEFSILLSELRLGKKRIDALRSLAQRTGHPDLSLVAITIAHGEEVGAPITQTLKSVAEEVRTKRWDKIEEKAAKTPVYMVFPTIFIILPTLFIILFAPFILYYFFGGGK